MAAAGAGFKSSYALPKARQRVSPFGNLTRAFALDPSLGFGAGLGACGARLIALRAVRSLAGVLLRLGTLGFTQAHQRVSPFGNLTRASPLTRLLVSVLAWVLAALASSPFGRVARLRGFRFAWGRWGSRKPTKGFHPLETRQGLSPLTCLWVSVRAWVLAALASSPFGRFARLRGFRFA